MGEALTTLLPMFLFMLVPIWIPMVGVAVGWLLDRIGPRFARVRVLPIVCGRARLAARYTRGGFGLRRKRAGQRIASGGL